MSKYGQLYNEWLTHNTMSDHKDRMENDKGVEETHNTREVEEVAQYVIDNRYPRNEQEKVSDAEMYRYVLTKIHHQLQKARQDWLREEIVRLEGMKPTEVQKGLGDLKSTAKEYRKIDQAIQTIIDRYQAELDQDSSNTN